MHPTRYQTAINRRQTAKILPSQVQVLTPMDFFLPNIVRVRDLSRGAFVSEDTWVADRTGRSSLSSAYLGL